MLFEAWREGEEREAVAGSRVVFRDLTDEEVRRYVASGEWDGRAGGYAVQGLGATLIAAVHGDISNVIGLPNRDLKVGLPVEVVFDDVSPTATLPRFRPVTPPEA